MTGACDGLGGEGFSVSGAMGLGRPGMTSCGRVHGHTQLMTRRRLRANLNGCAQINECSVRLEEKNKVPE